MTLAATAYPLTVLHYKREETETLNRFTATPRLYNFHRNDENRLSANLFGLSQALVCELYPTELAINGSVKQFSPSAGKPAIIVSPYEENDCADWLAIFDLGACALLLVPHHSGAPQPSLQLESSKRPVPEKYLNVDFTWLTEFFSVAIIHFSKTWKTEPFTSEMVSLTDTLAIQLIHL